MPASAVEAQAVDVLEALRMRDGVATFAELLRDGVAPGRMARAVASGLVLRPHRGVYLLPGGFPPFAAARRLRGVVSHLSAAQFHGLELLHPPTAMHVTVPRALRKQRMPGVTVHRRDLGTTEQLQRWPVTDVTRTCLDCFRILSLQEAVVLGDSALRQERLWKPSLVTAADSLRGNGSSQARTASDLLHPRRESPLESVAAAEMYLVRLPTPEVQVRIETPLGPRRLDFWFPEHEVGVETDGFGTHGTRAGLLSDCVRHNGYVLGRVLVLRFGYEHIVLTPTLFTTTVALALDLNSSRDLPQCGRCGGLLVATAA